MSKVYEVHLYGDGSEPDLIYFVRASAATLPGWRDDAYRLMVALRKTRKRDDWSYVFAGLIDMDPTLKGPGKSFRKLDEFRLPGYGDETNGPTYRGSKIEALPFLRAETPLLLTPIVEQPEYGAFGLSGWRVVSHVGDGVLREHFRKKVYRTEDRIAARRAAEDYVNNQIFAL